MGKRVQKALSVIGILLLTVNASSLVSAEGEAKEMYKSAYEALLLAEMAQKGDESGSAAVKWSEALRKLKELQKAHPDWNRMIVESKIQQCEAALKRQGKEEATVSSEAASPSEGTAQPPAAEKRPTELQQHLFKGNELAKEKKYDEAIEEYKKALGIDPNTPVAYLNMATCYMDQDKNDDAVGMLKKALQAEPDYSKARYKLGEIYLKKNMMDMAVSEYRKVLQANPDDPVAHWEIAGMYFKIKKLDDSIKHYDRAAELFGETTPQGMEAIRNSEKIKLLKQEMHTR